MTFSLASYNILADAYINPSWYPGTPAAVLDPNHRHQALLDRIAGLDAEVVCLQEVASDVFLLIDARLRSMGYDGKYAQKAGGKPDGCALFFKRDQLVLRSVHALYYADGVDRQHDSGHLALIGEFEQEDRILGIANTHLKWDQPATPTLEHKGWRQVSQLLRERQTVVPKAAAWIICGDLNVTADSAVVRELQAAGLSDAYGDLPQGHTCFANGRAKRIDFLFHTANLQARPRDLARLDDHTPLPSSTEPSDHLPILAWFDWHARR